MDNIFKIIQNGSANIKLELNSEDLLVFSHELINRAKSELSVGIAETRKELYLTKTEVKKSAPCVIQLYGIGTNVAT